MRTVLSLTLFVLGCGASSAPQAVPATPVTSNIITGALPPDCPFQFGATWALETASSVRLPASGGNTDAASVVTVLAHTTSGGATPSILYQRDPTSCAAATFPQSVLMTAIGSDEAGEGFSGIIPAFPVGTHVCWKLVVSVCGVTATYAPNGLPAFDYTTAKAR